MTTKTTMQVRGYFNLYRAGFSQVRFIEYVNDSSILRTDVENAVIKSPTFNGWFTEWVEIHPNYDEIRFP